MSHSQTRTPLEPESLNKSVETRDDVIGSVREVISRAFTRLQHERLIVVEGRHLMIPDEAALEAFADQLNIPNS